MQNKISIEDSTSENYQDDDDEIKIIKMKFNKIFS